jgi:hypothetical protein
MFHKYYALLIDKIITSYYVYIYVLLLVCVLFNFYGTQGRQWYVDGRKGGGEKNLNHILFVDFEHREGDSYRNIIILLWSVVEIDLLGFSLSLSLYFSLSCFVVIEIINSLLKRICYKIIS